VEQIISLDSVRAIEVLTRSSPAKARSTARVAIRGQSDSGPSRGGTDPPGDSFPAGSSGRLLLFSDNGHSLGGLSSVWPGCRFKGGEPASGQGQGRSRTSRASIGKRRQIIDRQGTLAGP